MTISQLSLTDFRNLKSTTLDFHPGVNLISGDNGSGKTSLLESVHVLCQACSFRTHQLKKCIQHEKGKFLLFGKFTDYKAGISKTADNLEIRLNGETVKRRSELVKKTPVNIVNTDSFDLISGPPQQRRLYIDWCLFHVEQEYADNWLRFRHALKQRNRLLKSRSDIHLLDYWDDYLVDPSLNIMHHRSRYLNLVTEVLNNTGDLLDDFSIELKYQPGWQQDRELKECLQASRAKDIRSGFTNLGIHRDNIQILADGHPASDVLSRGQTKRLCLAMLVAILTIVKDRNNRSIILLIDDLRSELDPGAQIKIFSQLSRMNLQLFISNIESAPPKGIGAKEYKMFHVEHGMIMPQKNS